MAAPAIRIGSATALVTLFRHFGEHPESGSTIEKLAELLRRNGLFSVLADRMSLLENPRKRNVVLAQGLDIGRIQTDHLIRHGRRLNGGKRSDLVLKTKGGAVRIGMSTKSTSGMKKQIVKLPLCQRRSFSFQVPLLARLRERLASQQQTHEQGDRNTRDVFVCAIQVFQATGFDKGV